jgi:hypothetical protein
MDRIDGSKGYEEGNIQLTCAYVNNMRGTMPLNEFKEMCKAIANHARY